MVADNKNKPKFEFTNKITGSALPTDTFLEKLRETLSENGVSCSQTKEKTGEAKTTGVGMTMSGELGGGIAHSDIITNKWNPFNIVVSAKNYSILGKFKGIIKLTEMAKYHKKKKDTSYELKDYNLDGNIDFSPSGFWMFVLFCFGIYLGFKFSTGFWLGLIITIALPAIFYAVAHELGNKEIDIPKSKINDSVSKFEKYLQHHNENTMK
jgi:hypothetical protein